MCICAGVGGHGGNEGAESIFSETTTVQFDQLTDADIRAYVETGDLSSDNDVPYCALQPSSP